MNMATACDLSQYGTPNHFPDVRKKVERRLATVQKKALENPERLEAV